MSKKLVKREITDAVDILLEGVDVLEQGDIQDIEIDLLKAYHDHPFTLVLCQEIVQDKKRKFYYPARTSFSLDWLVRYNFSNSLGDKYPQ